MDKQICCLVSLVPHPFVDKTGKYSLSQQCQGVLCLSRKPKKMGQVVDQSLGLVFFFWEVGWVKVFVEVQKDRLGTWPFLLLPCCLYFLVKNIYLLQDSVHLRRSLELVKQLRIWGNRQQYHSQYMQTSYAQLVVFVLQLICKDRRN